MTSDIQSFRATALRKLTNSVGVYALCDLDQVPIYVGQSTDGIRSRVQRHLTSARSDVIANRQIDVWEIAFVWAWPVKSSGQIAQLEAYLFNHFDSQSTLMNGKTLPSVSELPSIPDKQVIQVIEDAEIQIRRAPMQRLPRQIQQYAMLTDYILNVKDAEHLKRSLDAHFKRLIGYHHRFL